MEYSKIYEIVKARHSVRSYLPRPIPEDVAARLRALIDDCNRAGNLHMQLVTDEPDAFGKSMMARYGKFRNVSNYICLVAKRKPAADRRLGFYGEKVVLLAQELGLNTCWVGLSYSKGNTRCDVAPDEKIYALIAIGYGDTPGVPSKSKSPEQICPDIADMPDWFRRGVELALLAPTALNQQKFKFALAPDGTLRATTSWGPYTQMDLGIALLHFSLAAPASLKADISKLAEGR